MFKNFGLLVGIALIWGSQFIINDAAIQVINPFELAFYRVFFGTLALSIILFLPSVKESSIEWNRRLVALLFALTLTESVIPFIMNGYGQQQVSSSMTAVLMASIPLMTMILDRLVNKTKTSTTSWIGLLIGLIGIVVLVYQDLRMDINLDPIYIGFVLIGAFGFSISLILMSRIPADVPALRFTRAILLTSTLVTVPFLFSENNFMKIDNSLWLKLIVLGSFASGIVYYMYLYLVKQAGPTFASLNNYLVPVVGVSIGVILNNEVFTIGHYLGFFIILIGLILVNSSSFKPLFKK